MPRGRDDEERLTADIIALAREYGRYGYRKVTALLRAAGWLVNAKRVERIWRREGLKVPAKQPKKGRLWLSDGSCVRLRPERPNHIWSYDFVEDRTHDGRKFRMARTSWTSSPNWVPGHPRGAQAQGRGRHRRPFRPVHASRGIPDHVRSDNGPEFVARAVQDWIKAVGAKTAYIEPGSPWDRPQGGATSRASTPGSGTSSWTARSSTACEKQRS